MNLLKYIFIGIVFIGAVTGCGKNTVETLMVPAQADPNGRGKGMSAVILPFADYSNGDNIASAFRRNILITESLTDNLTSNGFRLTVQEDVFQYLLDQEIISIAPYDDPGSASIAYELQDPDWSGAMKEKLQGYMQHLNVGSNSARPNGPGTHGLTSQEVVKIGRKFGADYIIRGRILEFRTRQEHTWAPWKRGILPFAVGGTSRMAFGFADSAKYDNWDNILAGGTWGGLLEQVRAIHGIRTVPRAFGYQRRFRCQYNSVGRSRSRIGRYGDARRQSRSGGCANAYLGTECL